MAAELRLMLTESDLDEIEKRSDCSDVDECVKEIRRLRAALEHIAVKTRVDKNNCTHEATIDFARSVLKGG